MADFSVFSGFPAGKVRFSRIPDLFFQKLLPEIDNLNELKVTLYALWRLGRMEGSFRYAQLSDFSEDRNFMRGLGGDVEDADKALRDALEGAVKRGTLLMAEVELEDGKRKFYFLNTVRGQAAIKGIDRGDWKPSGDPQTPIELMLERPNIYRLYEEHIGPLTPHIADTLREAETEYPIQWIEEAVGIAVENNARSWRYIDAILRSWQEKGKDERKYRGDSEKDRRKYIDGEFSEFIEH
jgi:DnaD/phage-associated family protein